MFIYSIKFSKIKVVICCAAVIVGILAVFVPRAFAEDTAPVSLILQGHKISDNDDRIQYLKSFGWEVQEEPETIEEIIIPEDFNEVFQKYNEIQKLQGFDLEKYKNQRVKRYTYIVTNYPDEPDYVRANIFIFKNKVIAGDICSLKVKGGFLHGLKQDLQDNSSK